MFTYCLVSVCDSHAFTRDHGIGDILCSYVFSDSSASVNVQMLNGPRSDVLVYFVNATLTWNLKVN